MKAGEPVETVYTVSAEIVYNLLAVAERHQKPGQFVQAETYLKKPSWIQTLVMVMVLCLLVYAMAEF